MKMSGKFQKRSSLTTMMHRFGKKVEAPPPEPKNVLLQTYFSSLLSLVVCVSMFLGTSMQIQMEYTFFISS